MDALNSLHGQWGCCRYSLQAGLLFDNIISLEFPSFFASYVYLPGEQQTSLQLLLESVSFYIRAEHLIDSFHYSCSSSISLKGEVTLKVGECTEDTYIYWGRQPTGDVESRMLNVAIYVLLSCLGVFSLCLKCMFCMHKLTFSVFSFSCDRKNKVKTSRI